MKPYEIRTYQDSYEIYELIEHSTRSWFKIAPERGGIVISFGANGQELLYLDKATFDDPNANIRGGIPVLFPISGQLADGSYEWNGQRYRMKNHGVARVRPWRVESTDTTDGAAITLTLASDAETRESYPFDFELRFTYRLKGGQLTIEQEYRNGSAEPMPMYPGFHPYFVADRKALAYETDATKYFDYNDGMEKSYDGRVIDLDKLPESVVFLNAQRRDITFSPAERLIVRMTYGEPFKYVVLWSVSGKGFVCVEPWMAKTDELNRKQELVEVPPGGVHQTFLTISRMSV
ncbi:aldose epimerase [Paenibacillus ehimensis]|uniref:Aldose epimerase n=1 Tax=Paenibacillus ehimensis TaxID=79264 RepID=A0ABT8VF76_9BACL|nr:aldose epimerase [Paenibacillus ehimensis]MDO3679603.1 aldose epimerase [Paenibacillus ehimensis]